jgi:hypothetical protein
MFKGGMDAEYVLGITAYALKLREVEKGSEMTRIAPRQKAIRNSLLRLMIFRLEIALTCKK